MSFFHKSSFGTNREPLNTFKVDACIAASVNKKNDFLLSLMCSHHV